MYIITVGGNFRLYLRELLARLVLETKYGIIEVWRSGIGTPLAGEVSRYPGVSNVDRQKRGGILIDGTVRLVESCLYGIFHGVLLIIR